MATNRDESRKEWIGSATLTSINSGSLQRIADAVEKMAESYDQLRAQRDSYERLFRNEKAYASRLLRKNAALRGVITRMKKT